MFVFSDQGIGSQLGQLQDRGVQIRGVIDSNFAYQNYSSTVAMWGLTVANKDCHVDPNHQPWKVPATTLGVSEISEADKLHHKFAVMDKQIVITGSHNWSKAGNRTNDENLLVIDSPVVAAHFHREMERLLSTATFGPNPILLSRAREFKTRCGEVSAAKASDPVGVVNVNTASIEDLDSLPGIGATLAERIVAARPVKSWQELDPSKGLGQASWLS